MVQKYFTISTSIYSKFDIGMFQDIFFRGKNQKLKSNLTIATYFINKTCDLQNIKLLQKQKPQR